MPYYVIAPVLVEEYLPCALFRYFRKKKTGETFRFTVSLDASFQRRGKMTP